MLFIGIVLIVLGVIFYYLRPQLSEEDVYEGERKVSSKAPPVLLMFSRGVARGMFVLGLFLAMTPYLFFWADATEQYFLVYPTGHTSVVTTQGIKFRGFAKITPWQKYIDVKVVDERGGREGIEGVMAPIPIRFIDQVTATVYISCRFQLPLDEESFETLAIKFRSMSNLVNNTLIPTVREQTNNTGYMFAAQDYISGEAQSFRQTLDEQLKDGAYAVEKLENKDTIYTEIQRADGERSIKEIQTSYTVNKILQNGVPKRISHEITENNIIVSQVIVDDVVLESTFKKRLEAQRDESAKRQLEQQKIETAKSSQQRILAEGERDKAAERVAQEKEQVKQLIAIETKLKQEKTNKELAAIALETERLKSQQRKVAADAKAYENSRLVSAGLTPQERAEWEYKTTVGVAKEISNIKFPETMITGESKGGTPLESLIGAAMAKQLLGSDKNKKSGF